MNVVRFDCSRFWRYATSKIMVSPNKQKPNEDEDKKEGKRVEAMPSSRILGKYNRQRNR